MPEQDNPSIEELGTDLSRGLTSVQVNANRSRWGNNQLTQTAQVTFLQRLWETLADKTLIVLIVAAVISIALGFFTHEFLEGIAILIAVAIASLVGAFNEHQKDREFAALNKVKEDVLIKVIRGGEFMRISVYELVVGDLIELQTGDKIPADGFLARGVDVRVDQSTLTGEAASVRKDDSDPELLCGTVLTDGHGMMVATAVGDHSEYGKLRLAVQEGTEETPLQERLSKLADQIGIAGTVAAVLTFAALMLQGILRNELSWPPDTATFQALLQYAIIAVTIVVVAVPEGLPLAVTASLAYSVRKMMADNNLVRRLMACETMGAATVVCTDKTGTLTYNHMRVAAAWLGGQRFDDPPDRDDVTETVRESFCKISSINSTARLEKDGDQLHYVGNVTECALLAIVERWGEDYVARRASADVLHQLSFSSARKRMTTLIRQRENTLVLVKGAPGIVLGRCSHLLQGDGKIPLDDATREEAREVIDAFSGRALRTLALAYRNAPGEQVLEGSDKNLVLVGIVGIADPPREDVPEAIARCRGAGIDVKMVTGDNRATAEQIARQIGMLDEGELVMTGPELDELNEAELRRIAPDLRILARSSPGNKHQLVHALRERKEVVAVTGDGTNDAPALRHADVGLSMGLCGTEVAKEASDIVLLDDNFSSIVRAAVWGRSIFENIRKFLQFQLTVNVAALAVAFTGALLGFGTPLTAVQLLWVNLIMDTLAALALGLEPPSDELLEQPPHGRHAPLISKSMWFSILAMGAVMFAIEMIVLTTGVVVDRDDPAALTMVFNIFVLMQVFNEVNCRSTRFDKSVWKGILSSHWFISIVAIIVVLQVGIVQFGGDFFRTIGLSPAEWGKCVLVALVILPVGYLLRFIGRMLPAEWFEETA